MQQANLVFVPFLIISCFCPDDCPFMEQCNKDGICKNGEVKAKLKKIDDDTKKANDARYKDWLKSNNLEV